MYSAPKKERRERKQPRVHNRVFVGFYDVLCKGQQHYHQVTLPVLWLHTTESPFPDDSCSFSSFLVDAPIVSIILTPIPPACVEGIAVLT